MVFSERKSVPLPLYLVLVLVACVIYVTPIPGAPNIRIDAVALLVLYVNFYRPAVWPLTLGFCTGILQDIVAFAPLGQHALGLVLICFFIPWMRDSLRMHTPAKQLPLIVGILMALKFLSSWVTALNLGILPSLNAVWAVLLTSLFWPVFIGKLESVPKIRPTLV
jgi:rod shape-determining protein MreD